MKAAGSLSTAERKKIGAEIAKAVERVIKATSMYLSPEPPEDGGRSVYVLQLRNEALECPRCAKYFAGARDRRAAFYVGKTGDPIAKRIAVHRAFSHHKLKRGIASVVAPHLIAGDPHIEVLERERGRSLERRIKFAADQRHLEEVVLPRVLRKLGFGVHAGGKTNPDGTWQRD